MFKVLLTLAVLFIAGCADAPRNAQNEVAGGPRQLSEYTFGTGAPLPQSSSPQFAYSASDLAWVRGFVDAAEQESSCGQEAPYFPQLIAAEEYLYALYLAYAYNCVRSTVPEMPKDDAGVLQEIDALQRRIVDFGLELAGMSPNNSVEYEVTAFVGSLLVGAWNAGEAKRDAFLETHTEDKWSEIRRENAWSDINTAPRSLEDIMNVLRTLVGSGENRCSAQQSIVPYDQVQAMFNASLVTRVPHEISLAGSFSGTLAALKTAEQWGLEPTWHQIWGILQSDLAAAQVLVDQDLFPNRHETIQLVSGSLPAPRTLLGDFRIFQVLGAIRYHGESFVAPVSDPWESAAGLDWAARAVTLPTIAASFPVPDCLQ